MPEVADEVVVVGGAVLAAVETATNSRRVNRLVKDNESLGVIACFRGTFENQSARENTTTNLYPWVQITRNTAVEVNKKCCGSALRPHAPQLNGIGSGRI